MSYLAESIFATVVSVPTTAESATSDESTEVESLVTCSADPPQEIRLKITAIAKIAFFITVCFLFLFFIYLFKYTAFIFILKV